MAASLVPVKPRKSTSKKDNLENGPIFVFDFFVDLTCLAPNKAGVCSINSRLKLEYCGCNNAKGVKQQFHKIRLLTPKTFSMCSGSRSRKLLRGVVTRGFADRLMVLQAASSWAWVQPRPASCTFYKIRIVPMDIQMECRIVN